MAQRLVQPFEMARFAGIFADLRQPFRWQDLGVALPEIAVQEGAFAIIGRQRLSHRPTCRFGAVAEGDPDDPTGLAFQRQPNPDILRYLIPLPPKRRENIKTCDPHSQYNQTSIHSHRAQTAFPNRLTRFFARLDEYFTNFCKLLHFSLDYYQPSYRLWSTSSNKLRKALEFFR